MWEVMAAGSLFSAAGHSDSDYAEQGDLGNELSGTASRLDIDQMAQTADQLLEEAC